MDEIEQIRASKAEQLRRFIETRGGWVTERIGKTIWFEAREDSTIAEELRELCYDIRVGNRGQRVIEDAVHESRPIPGYRHLSMTETHDGIILVNRFAFNIDYT